LNPALINHSVDKQIISFDLGEELEKLRNITYYAEWWNGDIPTSENWT
jgi:hypothetical protein